MSALQTTAGVVADLFTTPVGVSITENVDLSPGDEIALDKLGLGGASPVSAPPYFPYNENGLYWSQPLALAAGDVLNVTVSSLSPVSWFGVDWSSLDVRGVMALTDVDEDGWNFAPMYPDSCAVETASSGTDMKLTYQIGEDGSYQVVIKNSSSSRTQQMSLTLTSQPLSAASKGSRDSSEP